MERDQVKDDKTSHVIDSHMWPLNMKNLPHPKEAWIVCIADQCAASQETRFSG